MDTPMKIAVVIGSLRKGSFTRKTTKAMIALAPPSLACEIVEIADLPLYNEDMEADTPTAWKNFHAAVAGADGVLLAAPEYNRSIPGGLKNAIDVGSRPYGKSVWSGKPAAVVSVSPGAIGGFGANIALRSTFVFLDVHAMQQPEAYIGGAATLFDDSGAIKVDATREFLTKYMSSFSDWTKLFADRVNA
jgi:chromate reductase